MASSMIENDIKNLEYQTLKLPYEMLNKKFRQTQKNIDREVMKIQASVKEFERLMEKEDVGTGIEGKMEGVVEGEKKRDEEKEMDVDEGVGEKKSGKEEKVVVGEKLEVCEKDGMVLEGEKVTFGGNNGVLVGGKGEDCDKMDDGGRMEEGEREGVEQMKQAMQNNSAKLVALTKKLLASINDEKSAAETCKNRLQQLNSCCQQLKQPDTAATALKNWKKKQLDKMLVEYFLRSGYYGSGIKLAHNSGIEDLSNLASFIVSRDIEVALDNKDTTKCLAWCADNKSKLRKIKSPLEMSLRQQEFVELVRLGKKVQAVLYARRHFTTMDDPQYNDIQQCMGLLIFPLESTVSPYKHLLQGDRWTDLKRLFRKESYRMYQLNEAPTICLILQAGLSALKTPICFESADKYASESERPRKTNCPVCLPAFKSLSNHLPYALFSHSRLICFGSGEPMNEHNLPLMLPNGHAYGHNYLHEMSQKHEGQVTCPRTNQVFAFKDALKVFIM